MSNEKQQTSLEQFAIALYEGGYLQGNGDEIQNLLEKHLEMEREQSHLYSAFCFKCINEKIPVIKFEDWINL
jgi:hypothetical protein